MKYKFCTGIKKFVTMVAQGSNTWNAQVWSILQNLRAEIKIWNSGIGLKSTAASVLEPECWWKSSSVNCNLEQHVNKWQPDVNYILNNQSSESQSMRAVEVSANQRSVMCHQITPWYYLCMTFYLSHWKSRSSHDKVVVGCISNRLGCGMVWGSINLSLVQINFVKLKWT